MNKGRSLQWTQIEIDGDETAELDTKNLEVNLQTKDDEEENTEGVNQEKDSRKGFSSFDKNSKNEDDEDGTEVQENQNKRKVQKEQARVEDSDDSEDDEKPKRAHKRIKTLLGRLNERDQLLAQKDAELAQLRTQNRASLKQNYASQKNQWSQIVDAKEAELEAAHNSNDGAKIAKATKELADAQMRFNAFDAVASEFEGEEEEPQAQRVQPQQQAVPDAAKEWVGRNPWFQTDQKSHVIARMVIGEMQQEGSYDPSDDDYWEEVDKRLKGFNVKTGSLKGKAKAQREEAQDEDEPDEKPVKTKKKGSPLGSRSDEDGGDVRGQFTRSGNKITRNSNRI